MSVVLLFTEKWKCMRDWVFYYSGNSKQSCSVCVKLCVYLCVCVCVRACALTCVCFNVCVCAILSVYLCLFWCMCVCVCVCLCVCFLRTRCQVIHVSSCVRGQMAFALCGRVLSCLCVRCLCQALADGQVAFKVDTHTHAHTHILSGSKKVMTHTHWPTHNTDCATSK